MDFKQLKLKCLIYYLIIKQIIINFLIQIYIKINEFQFNNKF